MHNPLMSMQDLPPVLVTGGARRIGRAIVEDLAAHGFPVIIHCHHSQDEAHEIAKKIKAAGERAFVVTANLADSTSLPTLWQEACAPFGQVRLLVNNASLFMDDQIGSLEDEQWEHHFAVHLKAPVFLAQEMHKSRVPGSDALIVNIIDQRVWRLNPRFMSYTLSKSALWTATQTMAQALAPHIRVNALGPGPTLANERQNEHDFAKQVSYIPLQRSPELSEFGQAIRAFWQMKSITGQMLALDGGQHLAWETPDVVNIKE